MAESSLWLGSAIRSFCNCCREASDSAVNEVIRLAMTSVGFGAGAVATEEARKGLDEAELRAGARSGLDLVYMRGGDRGRSA